MGERRGSDPNVSSLKCDGYFVLCFIAKKLNPTSVSQNIDYSKYYIKTLSMAHSSNF